MWVGGRVGGVGLVKLGTKWLIPLPKKQRGEFGRWQGVQVKWLISIGVLIKFDVSELSCGSSRVGGNKCALGATFTRPGPG